MFVEALLAQGGALTLGGSGSDFAKAIAQTRDGGFVIAGYTNSFGDGSGDVYVARFNSAGQLMWVRSIGGENAENAFSVTQTRDGGFLVVGYVWFDFYYTHSIYAVKLDSLGNPVWTKMIGNFSGNDVGRSVVQTNDEGFVIVGRSNTFSGEFSDVYIVKLDSSGNLLWAKTIGDGFGEDKAYSVIQTDDGGLLIAGYTHLVDSNGADIYVIKLDSAGNLEWTRTIGTPIGDIGYSVIQTKDGGFAIAGSTQQFDQQVSDVYVIKLNRFGQVIWTRTIGDSLWDEGNAILELDDSDLVVVGSTCPLYPFQSGDCDILLIRLDQNGNLKWAKVVGGEASERSYGVMQGANGDLILAGEIEINMQQSLPDVLVIRLDSTGSLDASCPILVAPGNVAVGSGGDTSSGGVFQDVTMGTMVADLASTVDIGGNVASCGSLSSIQEEASQQQIQKPTIIRLSDSEWKMIFPEDVSVVALKLTDLTGKVLYTYSGGHYPTRRIVLNITLPTGIFFIHVRTSEHDFIMKIHNM